MPLENVILRVCFVIMRQESSISDLSASDLARSGPQMVAAPQFHVESIRGALRERTVGASVTLPGRSWRAVFLDAGQLRVRTNEGEQVHSAPCFLWHPGQSDIRLFAGAGSSGATLLLGDTMLANILGLRPEAADIRLMLARPFSLNLTMADQTRQDLSASFEHMLVEQNRDAPGSVAIVEAHARIMTVLIWRQFASDTASQRDNQQSRVLQSFRQLLETNFRQRWKVYQYANALGVSTDRLNDLCNRLVGRPPKQLIRERLIYEAQLLLDRSSKSLEEVAGLLGFADAAQFSKTFKLQTGWTPGQFRKMIRTAASETTSSTKSYADWP